MRGNLVVANWKANPPTLREAKTLFSSLKRSAKSLSRTTLVICPPVAYLAPLALTYRGSDIAFGSQDVSAHAGGAHTGEVTVTMLKSLGAKFSIVGHSERRAIGETNDQIAKKLVQALEKGLGGILCVGERERDSEAHYLEEIRRQITSALLGKSVAQVKRTTIAYEPVWAIGKDADAAISARDLHQMVLFIKKVLTELYPDAAKAVSILYGGSVEAGNAKSLMHESGVSGFLVGHASLSPDSFLPILDAVEGRARLA